MIIFRPFHARPYTTVELLKWFGSVVANKEQAPLRRVVHLPWVWNERWDLWARIAIANGSIVPPRKP